MRLNITNYEDKQDLFQFFYWYTLMLIMQEPCWIWKKKSISYHL